MCLASSVSTEALVEKFVEKHAEALTAQLSERLVEQLLADAPETGAKEQQAARKGAVAKK